MSSQYDGEGAPLMKWNPKVACRTLEGNAFVLLDSRMVRLNEVGTQIWEHFEGGATIEEVVETVVEQYDADVSQIESDARAFVVELCKREMLVPAEAGGRSL